MAEAKAGSTQELLKLGKWPSSRYPVILRPGKFNVPMYCLGLPGMGKSVLLGNLALQMNQLGDGVLVIDVKDGELAKDVAARAEWDRLVYVQPGGHRANGTLYHWGVNPLELPNRDRYEVDNAVANALAMFERINRADLDQMQQMRRYLTLSIKSSLYDPNPNLVLVRRLLTRKKVRDPFLAKHRHKMPDELTEEWDRYDDGTQGSGYGRQTQISSSLNRLFELLVGENLNILLTNPTTLHLGQWLEEGKIVVVNCAEWVAWPQREVFGSIILSQAMNHIFKRKYRPGDRVIRLVCDEFHKYAGANFTEMLDLGRSTGVFPIMAHQNMGQIKTNKGKESHLDNTATGIQIAFRLPMTSEDIRLSRDLIEGPEIEEIRKLKKTRSQALRLRRHPRTAGPWTIRHDQAKRLVSAGSPRPT